MIKLLTNYLRFVTYALALYCAAGLALLTGLPGCFFLVTLIVLAIRKRRRRHLTTLGSARWADEADVKDAGMLGADAGLILGRLSPRSKRWAGLPGRSPHDELVRLTNGIHTAIFAPTGAGKGVSLAIPFLLTSSESCVVTDFKGELATLTAEHRRKVLGHRVVLLDPYRVVTQRPDTFNPLDCIAKDHPLSIDDCNDLAAAVVVRSGEEREPHWNDSAEAYVAAVAATVVGYGEPGTRSLQTVRDILSHPKRLDMATRLMIESDRWGGALASMGGQLLHFADKEKSSVLSSALRHLRFLGTPAIAESTATSTFDPSQLRNGRMTVYLILPPDRAHAQSGLLRMWVGSMLRACVRGGVQ